MKPRVGTTLFSATDGTTVVVVRWGSADVDLRCGGAPLLEAPSATPRAADPALQDGSGIGKRYTDGAGVELLCTGSGPGTLTADGRPMSEKASKPLPASD